MKEKLKSNKLFSVTLSIVFLIIIVSVLSLFFSKFNINGNITSISNGKLETSIVLSNNIFSKDGITSLLSNVISNFNLVKELTLIIISLFSVSILDSSGLIYHVFNRFKHIKSNIIIFLTIVLGILFTMLGEYSYIILLPLVPVIYINMGKNPLVGLINIFIGITFGYGVNIFNYNFYSLSVLTELSASLEVDKSYVFKTFSNTYIMLASVILMPLLITGFMEKYIIKKIPMIESDLEDKKISKKALIISLVSFLLMLIVSLFLIRPNSSLIDNTLNNYIAKIFSPNSTFNQFFMCLYLIISIITSFIYGFISKNFNNNHEFSDGLTKYFDNIGNLFVFIFLYSVLSYIVTYTNIDLIIISKLMYLLEILNFTGIPLIVITFIAIFIMSILMPDSLSKWTLISPTLVPIFMRANITPDFTQFLFSVASSIGSIFTPLFIYLIIMLGIYKKYDTNNQIGLFSHIKLLSPIILALLAFIIVLLVIWYISGLPLGINTFATM